MVVRPTTPHVLARLRVRIHEEGKVRGFDNCRLRVREMPVSSANGRCGVDEAQSSPAMTMFRSAKEILHVREGCQRTLSPT